MKSARFFFLVCLFSFSTLAGLQAAGPDGVSVIVGEKKIWLVAEEFPFDNLSVRILDANGKVVLEQVFTPKDRNWSLDLSQLPSGNYTLRHGQDGVKKFSR